MARNARHQAADAPLRTALPAPHWKQLRQGDRVRVLLSPGFETGGIVDTITADHTAVWVHLDGGARPHDAALRRRRGHRPLRGDRLPGLNAGPIAAGRRVRGTLAV